MSDVPKSLQDEIDERIDRRLQALQDSMELKLVKQTDSIFKERFDGVVKLLSRAFGLVAIVFAAFGVKTALDVRDIAKSSAIEEVQKRLYIDDPNSEFRREADSVIARWLINSYFVLQSRNVIDGLNPDIRISDADRARIMRFVSDHHTSSKDFSDAVNILFYSLQDSSDSADERLLLSMASATDENVRWIASEPDKRAAIFSQYKGDKLAGAARSLLTDAKTDKVLLLAAIDYSAKIMDKGVITQLGKLADTPDEVVSRHAITALGRISPDSKALQRVLFPSGKDLEPMAMAVNLAIVVGRPSTDFGVDPLEAHRVERAARVIENAISNGFVFRLNSTDRSSGREVALSTNNGFTNIEYEVSSNLFLGRNLISAKTLQDTGSKKATLLKTVRALCLEAEDERCWGSVRVNLEKGGAVELENGKSIDRSIATTGVTLRAATAKADADVIAAWTDSTGSTFTSKVNSVTDIGKVSFYVTPMVPLAIGNDSRVR